MDYSDDKCLYFFSEGQIKVMQACYHIFRLGDETHDKSPPIPLTQGISSEPLYIPPMQRQSYMIESNTGLDCTISYDKEGLSAVYTSWSDSVFSNSSSCSTDCTVRYPGFFLWNVWPFTMIEKQTRTLSLAVEATNFKALQDVRVLCE
jgi:hypothetical protein